MKRPGNLEMHHITGHDKRRQIRKETKLSVLQRMGEIFDRNDCGQAGDEGEEGPQAEETM